MTSTELKIGLSSSTRPSSRVLKPPGGGHSNYFAEPEQSVNAPRSKYNQQNSSYLYACVGSTDPNVAVEKLHEEVPHKNETLSSDAAKIEKPEAKEATTNGASNNKSLVPPGGITSGSFW